MVLHANIIADFEKMQMGMWGLTEEFHWKEWFELFRLTSETCTRALLTQEYRRLYILHDPEKKDSSQCQEHALVARLIIGVKS